MPKILSDDSVDPDRARACPRWPGACELPRPAGRSSAPALSRSASTSCCRRTPSPSSSWRRRWLGRRDLPRRAPQPAAGRAPAVEPVRARAARPGRRRRDLRRLRDLAQPRAAVAVDRRRLLSRRRIRCSRSACSSCCGKLGGQTSRAAILDTVIVFCGVALVQWVFFIDPYNHRHFGTEGARLVAMAYPAVDVLLLVALTQLLVGPGGRTTAYRLLLASVALWVVADEIYGLNYDTLPGRRPGRRSLARVVRGLGRRRRSRRRWHRSPSRTGARCHG